MLRYMLDTDICIYAMRDRSSILRTRFTDNSGTMALSTVSLFELAYGAEKSLRIKDNMAALENFAARLELLAFDTAAACHAGQVRAELERKGTPIGAYDLMIAGHARASGLILVTNNTREFERVDGLRIEQWTS